MTAEVMGTLSYKQLRHKTPALQPVCNSKDKLCSCLEKQAGY